jgi:hypothetical protein
VAKHYGFETVEPVPGFVEFQNETSDQIGALQMVAANHQGQLSKLDTVTASVQSSLSAWQNTAIGIAAAIGVAIALLAGFQILNFTEMTGFRADTASKFDATNARLEAIEANQKMLPAEISQQILSVAASLATVRGEPPPNPQKPPKP